MKLEMVECVELLKWETFVALPGESMDLPLTHSLDPEEKMIVSFKLRRNTNRQ